MLVAFSFSAIFVGIAHNKKSNRGNELTVSAANQEIDVAGEEFKIRFHYFYNKEQQFADLVVADSNFNGVAEVTMLEIKNFISAGNFWKAGFECSSGDHITKIVNSLGAADDTFKQAFSTGDWSLKSVYPFTNTGLLTTGQKVYADAAALAFSSTETSIEEFWVCWDDGLGGSFKSGATNSTTAKLTAGGFNASSTRLMVAGLNSTAMISTTATLTRVSHFTTFYNNLNAGLTYESSMVSLEASGEVPEYTQPVNTPFAGHFNGNGNSIITNGVSGNVEYTDSNSMQLLAEDDSETWLYECSGGIVSLAEGGGSIANTQLVIGDRILCSSDKTACAGGIVGGVRGNLNMSVGNDTQFTIKNCGVRSADISAVNPDGNAFAGGLIGNIWNDAWVVVENCYVKGGSVYSSGLRKSGAGGLVGAVEGSSGVTLNKVYTTATTWANPRGDSAAKESSFVAYSTGELVRYNCFSSVQVLSSYINAGWDISDSSTNLTWFLPPDGSGPEFGREWTQKEVNITATTGGKLKKNGVTQFSFSYVKFARTNETISWNCSSSGNTLTFEGDTITAVPDPGYEFDQWQGVSSSTSGITAKFKKYRYQFAVASAEYIGAEFPGEIYSGGSSTFGCSSVEEKTGNLDFILSDFGAGALYTASHSNFAGSSFEVIPAAAPQLGEWTVKKYNYYSHRTENSSLTVTCGDSGISIGSSSYSLYLGSGYELSGWRVYKYTFNKSKPSILYNSNYSRTVSGTKTASDIYGLFGQSALVDENNDNAPWFVIAPELKEINYTITFSAIDAEAWAENKTLKAGTWTSPTYSQAKMNQSISVDASGAKVDGDIVSVLTEISVGYLKSDIKYILGYWSGTTWVEEIGENESWSNAKVGFTETAHHIYALITPKDYTVKLKAVDYDKWEENPYLEANSTALGTWSPTDTIERCRVDWGMSGYGLTAMVGDDSYTLTITANGFNSSVKEYAIGYWDGSTWVDATPAKIGTGDEEGNITEYYVYALIEPKTYNVYFRVVSQSLWSGSKTLSTLEANQVGAWTPPLLQGKWYNKQISNANGTFIIEDQSSTITNVDIGYNESDITYNVGYWGGSSWTNSWTIGAADDHYVYAVVPEIIYVANLKVVGEEFWSDSSPDKNTLNSAQALASWNPQSYLIGYVGYSLYGTTDGKNYKACVGSDDNSSTVSASSMPNGYSTNISEGYFKTGYWNGSAWTATTSFYNESGDYYIYLIIPRKIYTINFKVVGEEVWGADATPDVSASTLNSAQVGTWDPTLLQGKWYGQQITNNNGTFSIGGKSSTISSINTGYYDTNIVYYTGYWIGDTLIPSNRVGDATDAGLTDGADQNVYVYAVLKRIPYSLRLFAVPEQLWGTDSTPDSTQSALEAAGNQVAMWTLPILNPCYVGNRVQTKSNDYTVTVAGTGHSTELGNIKAGCSKSQVSYQVGYWNGSTWVGNKSTFAMNGADSDLYVYAIIPLEIYTVNFVSIGEQYWNSTPKKDVIDGSPSIQSWTMPSHSQAWYDYDISANGNSVNISAGANSPYNGADTTSSLTGNVLVGYNGLIAINPYKIGYWYGKNWVSTTKINDNSTVYYVYAVFERTARQVHLKAIGEEYWNLNDAGNAVSSPVKSRVENATEVGEWTYGANGLGTCYVEYKVSASNNQYNVVINYNGHYNDSVTYTATLAITMGGVSREKVTYYIGYWDTNGRWKNNYTTFPPNNVNTDIYIYAVVPLREYTVTFKSIGEQYWNATPNFDEIDAAKSIKNWTDSSVSGKWYDYTISNNAGVFDMVVGANSPYNDGDGTTYTLTGNVNVGYDDLIATNPYKIGYWDVNKVWVPTTIITDESINYCVYAVFARTPYTVEINAIGEKAWSSNKSNVDAATRIAQWTSPTLSPCYIEYEVSASGHNVQVQYVGHYGDNVTLTSNIKSGSIANGYMTSTKDVEYHIGYWNGSSWVDSTIFPANAKDAQFKTIYVYAVITLKRYDVYFNAVSATTWSNGKPAIDASVEVATWSKKEFLNKIWYGYGITNNNEEIKIEYSATHSVYNDGNASSKITSVKPGYGSVVYKVGYWNNSTWVGEDVANGLAYSKIIGHTDDDIYVYAVYELVVYSVDLGYLATETEGWVKYTTINYTVEYANIEMPQFTPTGEVKDLLERTGAEFKGWIIGYKGAKTLSNQYTVAISGNKMTLTSSGVKIYLEIDAQKTSTNIDGNTYVQVNKLYCGGETPSYGNLRQTSNNPPFDIIADWSVDINFTMFRGDNSLWDNYEGANQPNNDKSLFAVVGGDGLNTIPGAVSFVVENGKTSTIFYKNQSGKAFSKVGEDVTAFTLNNKATTYDLYNYGYEITHWQTYFINTRGTYSFDVKNGTLTHKTGVTNNIATSLLGNTTWENIGGYVTYLNNLLKGSALADMCGTQVTLKPTWAIVKITPKGTNISSNTTSFMFDGAYELITRNANNVSHFITKSGASIAKTATKWNYHNPINSDFTLRSKVAYGSTIVPANYEVELTAHITINLHKITLTDCNKTNINGEFELAYKNTVYRWAGDADGSRPVLNASADSLSDIQINDEDGKFEFITSAKLDNFMWADAYAGTIHTEATTWNDLILTRKHDYQKKVYYHNDGFYIFLADTNSINLNEASEDDDNTTLPIFVNQHYVLVGWKSVKGTSNYFYKTNEFNNEIYADTVIGTPTTTWNQLQGEIFTAMYFRKSYLINARTLINNSLDRYGYMVITIKDTYTTEQGGIGENSYIAMSSTSSLKKMQYYLASSIVDLDEKTQIVSSTKNYKYSNGLVRILEKNNMTYLMLYSGCNLAVQVYDQSKDVPAMNSGKYDEMIGYRFVSADLLNPDNTSLFSISKQNGAGKTSYENGEVNNAIFDIYKHSTIFNLTANYEKIAYGLTFAMSSGDDTQGTFELSNGVTGQSNYVLTGINVNSYITVKYLAALGYEFSANAFTLTIDGQTTETVLQTYENSAQQQYSVLIDGAWLRENYYSVHTSYSVDDTCADSVGHTDCETHLGKIKVNTAMYKFDFIVKYIDESNGSADLGEKYIYNRAPASANGWKVTDNGGEIELTNIFELLTGLGCYGRHYNNKNYAIFETWAYAIASNSKELQYLEHVFPCYAGDRPGLTTNFLEDLPYLIESYVEGTIVPSANRVFKFIANCREIFKITINAAAPYAPQEHDTNSTVREVVVNCGTNNDAKLTLQPNSNFSETATAITYRGRVNELTSAFNPNYYNDCEITVKDSAGLVLNENESYANLANFEVYDNITLTVRFVPRPLPVNVTFKLKQGNSYGTIDFDSVRNVMSFTYELKCGENYVNNNAVYMGDEISYKASVAEHYVLTVMINGVIHGVYEGYNHTASRIIQVADFDYQPVEGELSCMAIDVVLEEMGKNQVVIGFAIEDGRTTQHNNYGNFEVFVGGNVVAETSGSTVLIGVYEKQGIKVKFNSLNTGIIYSGQVSHNKGSLKNYALVDSTLIITESFVPDDDKGYGQGGTYTIYLKKLNVNVKFDTRVEWDSNGLSNYTIKSAPNEVQIDGYYRKIENLYVGREISFVRTNDETEQLDYYFYLNANGNEVPIRRNGLAPQSSIEITSALLSEITSGEAMAKILAGEADFELTLGLKSVQKFTLTLNVVSGAEYLNPIDTGGYVLEADDVKKYYPKGTEIPIKVTAKPEWVGQVKIQLSQDLTTGQLEEINTSIILTNHKVVDVTAYVNTYDIEPVLGYQIREVGNPQNMSQEDVLTCWSKTGIIEANKWFQVKFVLSTQWGQLSSVKFSGNNAVPDLIISIEEGAKFNVDETDGASINSSGEITDTLGNKYNVRIENGELILEYFARGNVQLNITYTSLKEIGW